MREIGATAAIGALLMLAACGGASGPGVNGSEGSGGINVPTTGAESSSGEPGTTAASGTSDTGSGSSTGGSDSGDSTGGESSTGSRSESTDTGGTTSSVMLEGSSSTMDCPSAEVQFEPVVPTVILLIDQSGSMTNSFDGVPRWDAVRQALIDPVDGVIAALENDVRFGLALYTSDGGDAGGECPVIAEEPPLVGNLVAITDVYENESPTGDTPTGDSIDAVVASLVDDMSEGPKIIVLATDGEPDTCEVPNPQEGQVEAVTAAENAFTEGVSTFVISVGNDVSEEHLQDMANAGVGWVAGDPDAPFYVPGDQAAMVAAFEDIINGVRSCVLTLDTAILPGQADQGTVTVNGEEIPFQDPDGWDVLSPTEIELLGTSCDAIQEGDVEVTVEFTCAAIVPG